VRLTTGRRMTVTLAGLAAMALVAAGCGDTVDATAAGDGIEITGVWARTSPAQASNGATYLQITSESADRLVSASVSSDVAAVVEIHETVAMDDSAMDDDEAMEDDAMEDDAMEDDAMEDEHAMTMREVAGGLVLPAGETITLEPGGLHLMMLDLVSPLVPDTSFELELTFEVGEPRTVTVEVLEDAP